MLEWLITNYRNFVRWQIWAEKACGHFSLSRVNLLPKILISTQIGFAEIRNKWEKCQEYFWVWIKKLIYFRGPRLNNHLPSYIQFLLKMFQFFFTSYHLKNLWNKFRVLASQKPYGGQLFHLPSYNKTTNDQICKFNYKKDGLWLLLFNKDSKTQICGLTTGLFVEKLGYAKKRRKFSVLLETWVGVNCSNCDCSTRICSTLLAANQLLDTNFIICSNPVNPG